MCSTELSTDVTIIPSINWLTSIKTRLKSKCATGLNKILWIITAVSEGDVFWNDFYL